MRKETKQNTIDFTSLLPIMKGIWKGECNLMGGLLALWEKQTDKSSPMAFRKAFITFAGSKGYCKEWAGKIARDAGFRVRAERSDKNKPKANKPKANKPKANKPKANAPKGKGVTPEQLAHMAKSLDAKGVKKLIGLLAAM